MHVILNLEPNARKIFLSATLCNADLYHFDSLLFTSIEQAQIFVKNFFDNLCLVSPDTYFKLFGCLAPMPLVSLDSCVNIDNSSKYFSSYLDCVHIYTCSNIYSNKNTKKLALYILDSMFHPKFL